MKYFLILFVILPYTFANAQKNLLPGKVETNNSQFIEGKIVYKDKSLTPQEIEFHDLKTGKSQKYKPSELKSFEVDGRRFVSRIINVDVTPQRLQKQDYLQRKNQVIDTLFLSVQVQSTISLFYYSDQDHLEHFFIQIEDGELIELIKHEYFDKVRASNLNSYVEKLITIDKYKNQLGYAFRSCPTVVAKLNNVTLKLNEIQKLLVEYNECSGNGIEYEQKNKSIKVQYGVLAGVSMQSLIFNSSAKSFDEIIAIGHDPSLNAIVGVSVNFIFPYNYNKWSISNLIMYVPFDSHATINATTTSQQVYDIVDYDLSGSYLKWQLRGRHCFSKKKVKPFINMGFSFGLLTSFKNEMNREIISYSTVSYSQSNALKKTKSYEMGLTAGTGVKIGNNFVFEYAFETSNAMSKYALLKSNFNRHYLILTYLFKN